MSYVKIILLVLQIADKLFNHWRDRGLIQQGEDQAIARAAADIFRKTEHAKKIAEKIDAMPESEVDDLLIAFEPNSRGSGLSGDPRRG